MTMSRRGATIAKPDAFGEMYADTVIHLVGLNGEVINTADTGLPLMWQLSSRASVQEVSTVFSRMVKEHAGLPEECIGYCWSAPKDSNVIVQVRFLPLDEYTHDVLTSEDGPGLGCIARADACQVCSGPCWDADIDNTREKNCNVCSPCYLCDRCRLVMADGTSKCYFCLTAGDLPEVHELHSSHLFHLRLLNGDLFETELLVHRP